MAKQPDKMTYRRGGQAQAGPRNSAAAARTAVKAARAYHGGARRRKKPLVPIPIAVALVAVVAGLLVAFPHLEGMFKSLTGITPAVQMPATGVDSPYAVHFVDVGQGDAMLLEADGKFALVDAGPPDGADMLVEYLEAAGVKRLEYLFLTHPHNDHYGGMQAVVQRFEVGRAVLPDLALAPMPTASAFEALLAALLEKQVDTVTAALGAEYPLGSGSVRVVHAGLATDDNYNLLSLGLLFEAGGLRMLNTGDGEKDNERAMLESGQDISASILSAGHHGSGATSNLAEFIEAVNPAIVVVSCGADNSYGHPHTDAVARYQQQGAYVLRTDEVGHIVVQPDADGSLAYGTSRLKA